MSFVLRSTYEKNMKQKTQVVNCEKCKNEFPGPGSLKKHLRKVHEVRNIALEENSILSIPLNFVKINK
jgi:hypothetical protein